MKKILIAFAIILMLIPNVSASESMSDNFVTHHEDIFELGSGTHPVEIENQYYVPTRPSNYSDYENADYWNFHGIRLDELRLSIVSIEYLGANATAQENETTSLTIYSPLIDTGFYHNENLTTGSYIINGSEFPFMSTSDFIILDEIDMYFKRDLNTSLEWYYADVHFRLVFIYIRYWSGHQYPDPCGGNDQPVFGIPYVNILQSNDEVALMGGIVLIVFVAALLYRRRLKE